MFGLSQKAQPRTQPKSEVTQCVFGRSLRQFTSFVVMTCESICLFMIIVDFVMYLHCQLYHFNRLVAFH